MNAPGGFAYELYATGGAQEWLMRTGAAEAPPILVLPPLLEEMNRTRAFLATLMRLLAARGFGCWLPDLPGTGESERALEHCRWEDWRRAAGDASDHVARASGHAPVVVSVRGGALLDDHLGPVYRFAPAEGASLTRDLVRASMLKPDELQSSRLELAGYALAEPLFAAMQAAKPSKLEQVRTVRLASDRSEADLKLEGPALWRRSEPANAPNLAEQLACDLASWCAACGDS